MAFEDNQILARDELSPGARLLRRAPWQIGLVVVVLAIQGIQGFVRYLPLIVVNPKVAIEVIPEEAVWFAFKCLFIVGLVRRWRWVFVLFLVVTAFTVVTTAPIFLFAPSLFEHSYFVNLVLVILTASAQRFYFPKEAGGQQITSTAGVGASQTATSRTFSFFRAAMTLVLFLMAVCVTSLSLWARPDDWEEVARLRYINFLVIGPLWAVTASLYCRSKARIVLAILALILSASALSLFQYSVFQARITPSPRAETSQVIRINAMRIQE